MRPCVELFEKIRRDRRLDELSIRDLVEPPTNESCLASWPATDA